MKDDGPSFVQCKVGLVQLGKRQVERACNLLAGALIRLADVDEDRTAIQQSSGFGWAYSGKRHD